MSDTLELSCLVTNGRIPLEVSQAVAAALRRMDGKRVVISLRKHVNRRSDRQNRAYWGIIVPSVLEMFTDAGNDTTKEEIHEYLKEHVGGSMFARVLIDPDGRWSAHRRRSRRSNGRTSWRRFGRGRRRED
jgi:hypothetical protein